MKNLSDKHKIIIHPDIIAGQEKYLNQMMIKQHGRSYQPRFEQCRSFGGHECQNICDYNHNSGLCTECWLRLVYCEPKLPKRYQGVNLNPKAGQETAFQGVENWLKGVRQGQKGNLFLFGSPGTGKTHAACAALIEVSLMFKESVYANLSDLLDQWGNSKSHDIAHTKIYLLVIDEITGEVVNKKSREEDFLYKLSTYRWENELPTIYISNFSESEFHDKFHERTISRLFYGSPTVINFTGYDNRAY